MAHLAPMNNGGTKFMCQLKRLTLQYCKAGGSSRGMRYYTGGLCNPQCSVSLSLHREYLSKNVVDFAKSNSHLTVYVRQRPGRHPRIVAEFCAFICAYSTYLHNTLSS